MPTGSPRPGSASATSPTCRTCETFGVLIIIRSIYVASMKKDNRAVVAILIAIAAIQSCEQDPSKPRTLGEEGLDGKYRRATILEIKSKFDDSSERLLDIKNIMISYPPAAKGPIVTADVFGSEQESKAVAVFDQEEFLIDDELPKLIGMNLFWKE